MVKILNRGVLPKDKVYEGNCPNCKTRFEFTHDEAKESCDPRDNVKLLSIVCPLAGCFTTIYVNAKEGRDPNIKPYRPPLLNED